jgi:hypothetical protein
MTKLVMPFPPPDWRVDQIPEKACWWRHAMFDRNKDGYLFEWVRYGNIDNDAPTDKAWDGISAVTLEWFDGSNMMIDAGMDNPTIWNVCLVHVEPIDYIDLLAVNMPNESFYRITEYGDKRHPGMRAMPDLDERMSWR